MAFLNGSQRATLFAESSAQYTEITLLNSSLYITDKSRRYTNFLNCINIQFISSELSTWLSYSKLLFHIYKNIPAGC